MEVLGGEDQWRSLRRETQQRAEHAHEDPAFYLRVEGRARGVSEKVEEQGDVRLVQRLSEGSESIDDRSPRRRLVVGRVDRERAAHEVRDEGVWGIGLERRAPHRHSVDTRHEVRAKLADQARLADAGLADDVQDPSLGLHRVGHRAAQEVELAVPTDELGRFGADFFIAASEHAVSDHALGLSLERERGSLLELERMDRKPPRVRAHQDLAERGRRFEALCRVHGVADHRVRALDVAGEEPCDDLAGVYPDPQGKANPVAPRQIVVEVADRLLHRKGRIDGALGVVLVRDRSAEDRHDGVTDVLVDRPFVAADLPRKLVEIGREHATKLLGVEALAQHGGAGEIGKENRYDLALLAQIRTRDVGHLQRRAFGCGAAWRDGSTVERGATTRAEAVARAQIRTAGSAAPARSDGHQVTLGRSGKRKGNGVRSALGGGERWSTSGRSCVAAWTTRRSCRRHCRTSSARI